MVTATRKREPYAVSITNGRHQLLADTRKAGRGGDAGMRPHELLESALAACLCMSIEMAAERHGIALAEHTVEVDIERLDHQTAFHVAIRFQAPLSPEHQDLVRQAAQNSPVAHTLSKPVRIHMPTITMTPT